MDRILKSAYLKSLSRSWSFDARKNSAVSPRLSKVQPDGLSPIHNLADAITQVAAGLAQRGFKKGDVFGILSPNVPEYAIIFHAVASLGGINTLVNPLYTEQEVAHQLKDAGARFLVTVPAFIEKARESAEAASIEELFVFGEADGATPFASLFAANGQAPAVEINPQRGSGRAALFQRHHRSAQGRDADAP